jgi:hypothetical protein
MNAGFGSKSAVTLVISCSACDGGSDDYLCLVLKFPTLFIPNAAPAHYF